MEKLLPNGLWLKFLGFFGGTVHLFHLSKPMDFGDIEENYKIGQKCRARVLYVNYEKKELALSLVPSVLSFDPVTFPGIEVRRIPAETSLNVHVRVECPEKSEIVLNDDTRLLIIPTVIHK